MSSKYRVTKGFKFHARPQTGAYSCSNSFSLSYALYYYSERPVTCNVSSEDTLLYVLSKASSFSQHCILVSHKKVSARQSAESKITYMF